MTFLRSIALIFVLAVIVFPGCKSEEISVLDIPTNPFMKEEGGSALVVAHRGGRNLFPENTLVAFDGARQLGVEVLELDVCLTLDDVLVTIHDVTIDRTCDGQGPVLDYTFDELQAFNFGYHFEEDGLFPYRDDPVRIPRLEQIFEQHSDARMIIEIKNPGATGNRAATILHNLAVQYGMEEKVAVFSFEDAVMQHFRTINTSNLYTGGSISDAIAFVLAAIGGNEDDFRRDVDVFSFPTELNGINLVTSSQRIIDAAKNTGIAIHFWTINNKQEMIDLIEKGVDGLITDQPDVMIETLFEIGG